MIDNITQATFLDFLDEEIEPMALRPSNSCALQLAEEIDLGHTSPTPLLNSVTDLNISQLALDKSGLSFMKKAEVRHDKFSELCQTEMQDYNDKGDTPNLEEDGASNRYTALATQGQGLERIK